MPKKIPHFDVGCLGYLLDFVGHIRNEKALIYKGFWTQLDSVGSVICGGGGN
jgi:hypothetical protein